MRERRRAAVVFIRCVGVKNLRRGAAADGSLQQPVGDAGFRVDLIHLGERKNIGGIVEVEKGTRVAGRLRELMVKAAASTTRNMGPHAVEDGPAALVLVHYKVQESPQKPAALRTPEAESPLHRRPDAVE